MKTIHIEIDGREIASFLHKPRESVMPVNVTKVSIGWTTIVGWLATAGTILPVLIQAIEEGSTAAVVAGPNKYLALFAIVIGGITQIGRMVQAAIKAHKAVPAAVESNAGTTTHA